MSDFSDDTGQEMLRIIGRSRLADRAYDDLRDYLKAKAAERRTARLMDPEERKRVGARIAGLNEAGEATWAALWCDCGEPTADSARAALSAADHMSRESLARLKGAVESWPTEAMREGGAPGVASMLAAGLSPDDAARRMRESGCPVSSADVLQLLRSRLGDHAGLERDGRILYFDEALRDDVARAWRDLAGDDPATLNGREEGKVLSIPVPGRRQANELAGLLRDDGIDAAPARGGGRHEVVAVLRRGGMADEGRERERLARAVGEVCPGLDASKILKGRDGGGPSGAPATEPQRELIRDLVRDRFRLQVDERALASLSEAQANGFISDVLGHNRELDIGRTRLPAGEVERVREALGVPAAGLQAPARDARLQALRGGIAGADSAWRGGSHHAAATVSGPGVSAQDALRAQDARDSKASRDTDADGIPDASEDLNADGIPDDREPYDHESFEDVPYDYEPLQDPLDDTISDAVEINSQMAAVERAGELVAGIDRQDGRSARV